MDKNKGNITVSKEILDDIEGKRNELSMTVGELDIVLELSYSAAMEEPQSTDWVSVMSVLQRIAKGIQSHIDNMETIIREAK
jgi:hypothetical protein